MKQIVSLGILLALSLSKGTAGNSNDNLQFFGGFQSHSGGIHAHHAQMRDYTKGLSPAFEIHAGFQTLGKHKWEHLYNFPAMGIGYFRGYPGKREILGTVNSGFLFMEFTTRERAAFSTRIKYSLGLAHFSQFHHPETNPDNQAIGTPFNVHFNANYSFLWRLSPHNHFTTGISFTHFSNGAYKKPNKGINIFDFNLGIRHYPGEQKPRHETPQFGPGINPLPVYNLNVMYAMGKMQKTIEPSQYNARSLSMNLSRQSDFTNRRGLGIDVFYDEYIKAEAKETRQAEAFKEYIHGAVHLSHDIVFRNLSAIFNLGYYVFYYVEPYKPIFQRIGLRYEFSSGLMAGLSLKTHYAKADMVEWGLGYRIF
ncbi:MAG: acyloxyacyl hydrolase [Bacteroidetes bacterium]|nr:MAG: acyloxyacyl hydrolase [Bacteroidota bacterium]